jgi:carboxyl-terminal processing protease
LKYTDAGRKVYGGGGIEPDKFMPGPVEGFNPSRFGRLLFGRQAFANYAQRFSAEGDTRIQGGKNRRFVKPGFEVTDEMVQEFRASLAEQRIKIDEDAFQKDREFIRSMIRYDIDLALFGVETARRRLLVADPQAQFALSQFPDALKLSLSGRARTQASRGAVR